MVVQHNLTAMNSNRMLGLTASAQAKSTEKLSSGYKINRAADDAAGLAISEKMRKQIRGLTQASANAQDGISTVQTAEGALTEVHDMLQRMNELAVKAANGTNSESDRTAIQQEIDQLTTEIDRVAETTKFNETYLLKGDSNKPLETSYSYMTFCLGTNNPAFTNGTAEFTADAVTGLTITFAAVTADENTMEAQNELIKALRDAGASLTAISEWDANAVGGATAGNIGYSLQLNGEAAQKFKVVLTTSTAANASAGGALANTSAATAGFAVYTNSGVTLGTFEVGNYSNISTANGDHTDTVVFNANKVTASVSSSVRAAYYDKDGNKVAANELDNYFTTAYAGRSATQGNVSALANAPRVYDAVGNRTNLNTAEIAHARDVKGTLDVSLHVGADATSNNQITMNLKAMNAKGLGINGLKMDGPDDTKALEAIGRIKAAITRVSSQRSELGSIQNRLEHTINNLDNIVENTTSAESSIRDTDMASEMVRYSNNNILMQAGQSMLAQANQSNQGVLSLLQ